MNCFVKNFIKIYFNFIKNDFFLYRKFSKLDKRTKKTMFARLIKGKLKYKWIKVN